MDTNKEILVGAIDAAVVIGSAAIDPILGKTPEKADLSTVHTEAVTGAPKETLLAIAQVQEIEETVESQGSAASSVSTSIETYTSGKISIQYPAAGQLDDASKKDKANELLRTNALSVTKVNDIDEVNDTLNIKCRVTSVDRKCLTAIYIGTLSAREAAHPVNLFYSNTVNLLQARNLGLDDFTDAYTMAGYVLSDGMKFSGIPPDVEAQVLSYHSSIDSDSLVAVSNSADFPLSSETQ